MKKNFNTLLLPTNHQIICCLKEPSKWPHIAALSFSLKSMVRYRYSKATFLLIDIMTERKKKVSSAFLDGHLGKWGPNAIPKLVVTIIFSIGNILSHPLFLINSVIVYTNGKSCQDFMEKIFSREGRPYVLASRKKSQRATGNFQTLTHLTFTHQAF